MRSSFAVRFAVLMTIANAPLLGARGVQAPGYDQLVSKAQADLSAGRAAEALSESRKAIVMNPGRWEAYVAAAGALQIEHSYIMATARFKQALARSPEAKKAAISSLLQKCEAEQNEDHRIAQKGEPEKGGRQQTTPHEPNSPTAAKGPSLAATVDYLKSKLAAVTEPYPGGQSPGEQPRAGKYPEGRVAITGLSIEACHLIFSEQVAERETAPSWVSDERYIESYTADLSTLDPASVHILDVDNYNSWEQGRAGMDVVLQGVASRISLKTSFTSWNQRWNDGTVYTDPPDNVAENISSLILPTGSADIAPHIVNALSHLIELCKDQSAAEPF